MRFFRNAARSAAKTVLRGCAQKRRLRGGDVRAKKWFKKITSGVPEIKLFTLLSIGLIEEIHY